MSFFQENGFRVSTNRVAEFRAICRVAVWWKGDVASGGEPDPRTLGSSDQIVLECRRVGQATLMAVWLRFLD
jgi:hypothetical protein